MKMDVFIADMHQEMYRDAVAFYRMAEKNRTDGGSDEDWLRCLRAALLLSFASIEACINGFLSQLPKSRREHLRKITAKLTIGMELLGGVALDKDHKVWSQFMALKKLRDTIVHFAPDSYPQGYGDTFATSVRDGIAAAREVVIALYRDHPGKLKHPPSFDKMPT